MQTKMFVFVGVPKSLSAPTADELLDKLQIDLSTIDKTLQLSKRDRLIIGRYNDVSYYVSILTSKNELKDWLKMAKDFELSSDKSTLTDNAISDRYNELRILKPTLYSETDYSIAMTIFNTLKHFTGLEIISFQ